jgi:hypothetical protein
MTPKSFGWTADEFMTRYPDVRATSEQMACCRYLERQGKRFLVDFGYENAPAIVWREMDNLIYESEAAADLAVIESGMFGL